MSYAKGLHEVGDGLYAYLQPDGGWGWSNAGLVVDGESHAADRHAVRPRADRADAARHAARRAGGGAIDTLVNTHANGDHCYGNQLVGGARIVASERTAAEMTELPPAAMAALVRAGAAMGELGAFFLDCFGAFDFTGIELALPHETFSGRADDAGRRARAPADRGRPGAHARVTRSCTRQPSAYCSRGDILFSGAHPIAWAGPVSNWIAACDRILAMGVEVIVPGHGPLAGRDAVRELKAYFEYLYEEARVRHAQGMTPLQAARVDLARALGRLG